jgi:hypothetical protein
MLIPPHKGRRQLVRTSSLSPGVLVQQLVFYSLARCSVTSAICNLPLACALFPLAACGVVFTSEEVTLIPHIRHYTNYLRHSLFLEFRMGTGHGKADMKQRKDYSNETL